MAAQRAAVVLVVGLSVILYEWCGLIVRLLFRLGIVPRFGCRKPLIWRLSPLFAVRSAGRSPMSDAHVSAAPHAPMQRKSAACPLSERSKKKARMYVDASPVSSRNPKRTKSASCSQLSGASIDKSAYTTLAAVPSTAAQPERSFTST